MFYSKLYVFLTLYRMHHVSWLCSHNLMQYYLATGSDKFLLLIVFACDLADNTWFESILM